MLIKTLSTLSTLKTLTALIVLKNSKILKTLIVAKDFEIVFSIRNKIEVFNIAVCLLVKLDKVLLFKIPYSYIFFLIVNILI